jgi:hypothetical protein
MAGGSSAGHWHGASEATRLVWRTGSALLQNLLNRNALAIQGGALVGKWTDPKTGVAAIELSDRFSTNSAAIRGGERRDQIAVYDLDRKQTINTGGSGRR